MGKVGVTGADVCVARGVADRMVDDGVAVADAGAVACDVAVACEVAVACDVAVACGEVEVCAGAEVCAGLEACAGPEACAGLEVCGELEVCAELGAEAPVLVVAEACGEVVGDRVPWPRVGDGVRVPACVSDVGGVCGEGGKTVGDGVGPPVHAETATVMRTAPAADRPTASHAPRVSPGGVSRIFMNPPRMRVR